MLSNPRIDLILKKDHAFNKLKKRWFKAFLNAYGSFLNAIIYIVFALFVIYFMVALSGCSVYMAAKGVKTHNPDYVIEGMTRQQVLKTLGKPVISVKDKKGRILTDFFIVNKSDKASIKRALAHATLDTITIGLWEAFGTTSEMIRDKDCYKIVVQYNKDMRAKKISIKSLMPTNLRNSGGGNVDTKLHLHYYYDMSPRTIPGYVPGQTVIVTPNGNYYYGY